MTGINFIVVEEYKIMRKKIFIAAAVCLCIICGIFTYIFSCYQNCSAERLMDKYNGNIEQRYSISDKDQDGIDDQTDILNGALNYIALEPKYKSKYYQTGYPADGYGVCTDVVSNALYNAGYNLMELVQTDITYHPEDYNIDEPDSRIDFRRVKNLKIYFAHTAISLTTDISAVEEWQGGDIVIFEKHIGIISDRRNEKGIPYVIHHNDPWQTRYEQDILENYGEIVGHYRVTK